MSSNSSGPLTGVAYQSIIIALIAGGILTIGVVSILWRRRSQRHWASMRSDAHLPLGMGMGIGMGMDADGTGGRGGRKRKRLGRMPEVWDALIGRREGEVMRDVVDKGDEEVEEEHGAEKREPELSEKGQGTSEARSEVQVLAEEAGDSWRPISITLHEHLPSPPSPHPQHASRPPAPSVPPAYAAEMTVLIAMPTPDRPIPFDSALNASATTYSSDSSASKVLDYSAHYTYVHPPLPPHVDAEDEPIPDLAIATTSIPISPTTTSISEERDELQQWLDNAQTARTAGSSSNARRQRARDGYSTPTRSRAAPLIQSAGYRANQEDSRGDERDRDSEHEQENVGWAGRLGMAGVIRRGDMIARPRTPEQERRSRRTGGGGGVDYDYDVEANRSHANASTHDTDTEDDPRARPNLFRLANMSHSLGVFRFGNVAGLPPASGRAGAGRRHEDFDHDERIGRARRDEGAVGMAVHRAQYL